MTSLVDFLLSRIAEDEAAAQNMPRDWPQRVADALWEDSNADDETPPGWVNPLHDAGWDDAYDLGRSVWQAMRATYAPARVLAQCAAPRAVVALHAVRTTTETMRGFDEPDWQVTEFWCSVCDWVGTFDPRGDEWTGTTGCDTLRALAGIWRDHDEWREEWA